MRSFCIICVLLLVAPAGVAEDTEKTAEAVSEAAAEPQGDGIKSPKTLSGMSILGNEEAPKSLVIVPWKSARIGDPVGLQRNVDDSRQPVDREVFMRELDYYELRTQ